MSILKSPHQQRIEAFMEKAGQAIPPKPVLPDGEIRKLRAKLILEEALETITALGFVVVWADSGADSGELIPALRPHGNPPDLVGIADGCADISVVTVGTLSACGIGDEDLMRVVDENNLAKFGPGGYRREDGKWVKPPDHKAPDITGLLGKMSA